jgi:hypothetical protein
MSRRGGQRPGAGRTAGSTGPYKEQTRVSKTVRFLPEEWEIIRTKAESKNMSVSEYIRQKALE